MDSTPTPLRFRFLLPLVGALVVACARGEDAARPEAGELAGPLARADSIVSAWVADERVPGAVLVVHQGGRAAFEKAYGFARLFDYGEGQYAVWDDPSALDGRGRPGRLRRLGAPIPMTTDTRFDLASVTKVMATTFGVMLLVDDGAVDVEAPVSTYLPDFVGGGKETITVRHLLTHRSGLSQWQPTYYHASDPDAAYAYVRDFPLAWGVGEGRHYSDLGFMTLGRLVETVSGATLDAFLRDRLWSPLGLTDIGFGPLPEGATVAATSHGNPFEHRMVHDTAFGYRIAGDPDLWDGWRRYTLVGEVNDGNAHHAFRGRAGHAGLFATASDLGVLLDLLLAEGESGGRRYLSAETVRAFLADTGDGQALGWQVPGYAPDGSFAHTGFTGTWVLGVPSRELAVVLLTNKQNVGLDASWAYTDVGPLQRAVAAALTGG